MLIDSRRRYGGDFCTIIRRALCLHCPYRPVIISVCRRHLYSICSWWKERKKRIDFGLGSIRRAYQDLQVWQCFYEFLRWCRIFFDLKGTLQAGWLVKDVKKWRHGRKDSLVYLEFLYANFLSSKKTGSLVTPTGGSYGVNQCPTH